VASSITGTISQNQPYNVRKSSWWLLHYIAMWHLSHCYVMFIR
jgi:hypothetical protein